MSTSAKRVDSYRFIRGFTAKLAKNWIKMASPEEIPWTPLSKPLAESRVALLSSAAITLKTDKPFDQERERQDPWWGDPGFRIIPSGSKAEDVRICHLHINPAFGESDLNCVLPLDHLQDAVLSGRIGSMAHSHLSMMGYILQPEELLQQSVPSMIDVLKGEAVDVVILVPT